MWVFLFWSPKSGVSDVHRLKFHWKNIQPSRAKKDNCRGAFHPSISKISTNFFLNANELTKHQLGGSLCVYGEDCRADTHWRKLCTETGMGELLTCRCTCQTDAMPQRSKQPTVFWFVRLKYSLTRGIQNLLRQEPCKGAETDFRAKSGKETVAGAHRRPKWIPHYGGQADSGRGQDSSGSTQLCSGSTPACSPLAQVKAAVACVRRLKRNQRKGKLILSLGVLPYFVLLFGFCVYL